MGSNLCKGLGFLHLGWEEYLILKLCSLLILVQELYSELYLVTVLLLNLVQEQSRGAIFGPSLKLKGKDLSCFTLPFPKQ